MSKLDDQIAANDAEAAKIGPVTLDELGQQWADNEDSWEDGITRALSKGPLPDLPDDRLRVGSSGWQVLGDDGVWRDW